VLFEEIPHGGAPGLFGLYPLSPDKASAKDPAKVLADLQFGVDVHGGEGCGGGCGRGGEDCDIVREAGRWVREMHT